MARSSHVLLDRRSRAFVGFDISCHMDRLDIFDIGETGSMAPVQELTDRLVVSAEDLAKLAKKLQKQRVGRRSLRVADPKHFGLA
jgi:hypothetical protein